jgi:hypothetical protein
VLPYQNGCVKTAFARLGDVSTSPKRDPAAVKPHGDTLECLVAEPPRAVPMMILAAQKRIA